MLEGIMHAVVFYVFLFLVFVLTGVNLISAEVVFALFTIYVLYFLFKHLAKREVIR